MKSIWLKLLLTGIGMCLVFFGPADLGATVPVGLGLIALAWLEDW